MDWYTFVLWSFFVNCNETSLLTMPTILYLYGWRLFFYSNEGTEPLHVHAEKGSIECKFWINKELRTIDEDFSYNMSPGERRQIVEIINSHLDIIIMAWEKYFINK
jgi:hypothetical protein